MSQSINNGDRWLLPVGVEETLPAEAAQIEGLRRKVLDLLDTWGYELVMPPLMEFLDSLLTGVGHGLEIETFKLTDQISGRMMGVRADMTPQVARIDAHYLRSDGPRRLCYLGPVLRTRPDCLGCSRVPLQLGAELFGVKSSEADVEIVELLVETLHSIGLDNLHIDLGHMGVFQGLCRAEELDASAQDRLTSAIGSRSRDDVTRLCETLDISARATDLFVLLTSCSGDVDSLPEVAEKFSAASNEVSLAFENLITISSSLKKKLTGSRLYFDLAAIKGKSYHNGLVFSVYMPGPGRAIASGGRYDDIGIAFGRARAATGFSLDLRALSSYVDDSKPQSKTIIVNYDEDADLLETVRQLRTSGKRVIYNYAGSDSESADSNDEEVSQLVKKNGKWIVE
ncbi:MAG: ATP phosphoribosyltransferase regulatory subunit [Gammaproteobacteria bacterium]|nr:ATP phosphoribosyltransferase regulatory subunit [Gammaproteobacteria bacterium]